MMKVKGFLICGSLLLCTAALAGDFRAVPVGWKWISEREVAFTYDGSYTDSAAFSLSVPGFSRKDGIKAPGRYESFPGLPEGAQNPTWAPDSSRFAFTLGGNLYVQEAASGVCTPLSEDGSQLVLNGYASWVYYEEIFGRASNYRAFWWAPDSRHIAFYRFDDTQVPEFPIYSPKGTHGELRLTQVRRQREGV